MIYNGDNAEIKKELRKLLLDEGLTLSEIANRLNIGRNQLNHLFNKVNFSFTDLYKMLQSIGYDLKIDFIKKDK